MNAPPEASPRRRRPRSGLWLAVGLLAGIALIGATVRRPPAERVLAPAPEGWVRTTEPGTVLALARDGDRLWAGGKQGLFELDAESGELRRRVRLPQDPIHVRSLALDPDGSLWIGHVDGLIRYADEKARGWSSEDGLPADRVNVVRIVEGRVLVGTAAGLAERDGADRWARSELTDRLPSPVVNTMLAATDGSLWVGSSSDPKGGLTRIAGDRTQVWRGREGLPHPYVQDLAETEPGVVWAATGYWDQGGAACFVTGKEGATLVRAIRKRDGLAGEKARSVAADSRGALWIGSESDGLAIQRANGFGVLTMRDGLPHNEVTVILRDPTGTMWLGTLNGVVRIASGHLPTLDEAQP